MFRNLPRIPRGLTPRDAFTRFSGGLDIETPPWTTAAGSLRDAINYEIAVEDGYRDITGYERFDGRPRPSDASFSIIDVTITGEIVVGDTVEGADSGATGLVIAIGQYETVPDGHDGWNSPDWNQPWMGNTWFGSESTTMRAYLVLTKVTGTFQANENLLVGASVEGRTDAEAYEDSAETSKLRAIYKNLAADAYRADIGPVPGEGPVWGGFTLRDKKYAIRNKVGQSGAGLYEATASGWAEVDLGWEVAFENGKREILPGETIEGATSGATAKVLRVQTLGGSWDTEEGGDAYGYLTIGDIDGDFVIENIDIGEETGIAALASTPAQIALQPNGRLDYAKSNFADPLGEERVYCADGANFGWEFDGTVFAWIRTGMSVDKPTHVAVHKQHLFFSFGSSVQHSAPGRPFDWQVIVGAGEISTGHRITGFHVEPGSEGSAALLVACRQQLFTLYGNNVSDWNLVRYRDKVGAYEWTIQQVAYTLFLDDRGITDLRTTAAFGNFDHSSLSNRVRRLINAKKAMACASTVCRDKNQYRLFFTDDSAIYVTMAGPEIMGMMPIQLNHTVTTIWSEEGEDGQEEIYFGSDNGFVYQMERGTSFDGDPIRAYLYTHFDHLGQIQWAKSFLGTVTIEGRGEGYAEFMLGYELDHAVPEVPQPDFQVAEMPAAIGATWDSGLLWDTFTLWDSATVVPTIGLDLRGDARNISWIIQKDSDYFSPMLLTGVHFRYITRKQVR